MYIHLYQPLRIYDWILLLIKPYDECKYSESVKKKMNATHVILLLHSFYLLAFYHSIRKFR